jgi:hypothetical protein
MVLEKTMKFMMMVIGDPTGGRGPSPQLMAAIDELGRKARAAGKLLLDGGLKPPAAGLRVGLEKGKRYAVDGPFAETKEVVGGFALFELASREEALEHARAFVEAHAKCGITDLTVEVRPLYGPEDFAMGCGAEVAAAR